MASDCFGTGVFERVEIIGARPRMQWTGPSRGSSASARFELFNAPAGGFASLWISRISDFMPNTIVDQSSTGFPIGLRAEPFSFIRRFPVVPIDAFGEVEFSYFQNVLVEGGFFGQWIVFDANMQPLTTSEAAVNLSPF